MPGAFLTLVWFKGSYAVLKNETTIQVTVVVVVVRNQMLRYVKFHSLVFKSRPQTLI